MVLARNTTPNACPKGRNVADAMPAVQRALDGEANYAVWALSGSPFDNRKKVEGHLCSLMGTGLLELSAVPIWGADDQVAGVLTVGFEVSNGAAAEKSKALGMELAVIHNGEVYSTSFVDDFARQDLNQGLAADDVNAKIKVTLASGGSSEFFTLHVGGAEYRAVLTPVSNSSGEDSVAYLFMGSVDKARTHTRPLMVFLMLVVFAALVVVAIGVALGAYFMKPVLIMEEGLLKMINGDYGHRFDIDSAEFGGLGYRINQLVNVFTDQEESTDDDA